MNTGGRDSNNLDPPNSFRIGTIPSLISSSIPPTPLPQTLDQLNIQNSLYLSPILQQTPDSSTMHSIASPRHDEPMHRINFAFPDSSHSMNYNMLPVTPSYPIPSQPGFPYQYYPPPTPRLNDLVYPIPQHPSSSPTLSSKSPQPPRKSTHSSAPASSIATPAPEEEVTGLSALQRDTELPKFSYKVAEVQKDAQQKRRVKWTPALHKRFILALEMLGSDNGKF